MWINIQGTMYNTDHFVAMWEEAHPWPSERWQPVLTHAITSFGKELTFYQPGIIEEVTKHGR